uniref:Uncharacterized protein n=1 Tax=Heterorhabditis bacteriophora TaxID=37862 RepID=A0A1I7WCR2_HETBA
MHTLAEKGPLELELFAIVVSGKAKNCYNFTIYSG